MRTAPLTSAGHVARNFHRNQHARRQLLPRGKQGRRGKFQRHVCGFADSIV